MASPISPSTVHRILAHISPLEALPNSLISKPLLQRHHFLGLTPDDAAEYLAWPSSSDPSHLLQLLEGPLQDLGDHLNVNYTADSEEFLAHVCISSGLCLVFLWEIENGWQYHNLATMPFPPDSVEDFNDAYSRYSKTDFLFEPEYDVRASGGDDDDSYWNSYGQQNDTAPHFSASRASDDINSEDAYWARYSTIQGSADSTIPSPPPPAKSFKSEVNDLERTIVPSTKLRLDQYNSLGPPSPEGISRRLQALLPEPDDLSSHESDSGCETSSPHHAKVDASITVELQIQVDDPDDPFRTVLQDTIKNVYRLWRMGRQDKAADQDRDVFVNAVQHVLEGL